MQGVGSSGEINFKEVNRKSTEGEWETIPLEDEIKDENSSKEVGKNLEFVKEESPKGSVLNEIALSVTPMIEENDEPVPGEKEEVGSPLMKEYIPEEPQKEFSVSIESAFGKGEFSIGKALFGMSGTEIKDKVKDAINKDKNLSMPLRILKGIGRGTGLVLGMGLNLVSRAIAFTVSAAVSVVTMGAYLIGALFKRGESELWKNPTEAMRTIFAVGLTVGAGVGALVGTVGNVLIQASLSTKLDPKQSFLGSASGRAFTDNAIASIGGAAVGSAISLVNPLLWRAAFTKLA